MMFLNDMAQILGRPAISVLFLGSALFFGCTGQLGANRHFDDEKTGGDSEQSTSGDTHENGGDDHTQQADGGDSQQVVSGSLSEQYPNDQWDLTNPDIIYAVDFEGGMDDLTGWDIDTYTGERPEVINDPNEAFSGNQSMKLSFTLSELAGRGSSSISAGALFTSETGVYYVRFYMRHQIGTARPHHANGTRVSAPGFDVGGSAGLRPNGDEKFNTAIDIDDQGRFFFYTYWHEMRSGCCNDGTTDPECEGYQFDGCSYYYGNNFKPADQPVIDRYEWNCYEYRVQANTPNQYDGELALWINNQLIGEFKPGVPLGAWLRSTFYTMGEWGTDDRQVPFEGFNFRTSTEVKNVRVSLSFYQQQDTLTEKRDDTPDKTSEQAIFYDDVVIAKTRIGCRE